ncbi:hypothetical protein BGZ83_001833 [Gryganskiella cystojenkinii]|nr:hypothetical protein BGZ83_001833 [Gryganskiella cystojenkinii]
MVSCSNDVILYPVKAAATATAGILDYTIVTPIASTVWTTGQLGVVTITLTDKATKSTKPMDRFLTITLLKMITTGSSKGQSVLAATIRDRVQLLVPANSSHTSVTLNITNWHLPKVSPGSTYFINVAQAMDGASDTKALTSPATKTSTPTTTTVKPSSLPTQVSTCDNIRERCAASGLQFFETANKPFVMCHCGQALSTNAGTNVRTSKATILTGLGIVLVTKFASTLLH